MLQIQIDGFRLSQVVQHARSSRLVTCYENHTRYRPPGAADREFRLYLSDFWLQKWSGWVRTTLRIHLHQVRSILDPIRAIFDDVGRT